MPRSTRWILVLPLLYVLYFHGLTGVGLLGPDEPRYAAIGREMALSGDWVTPRLWGEPWFEKPALLYWLIAAASLLGLNDDLAPRLPVALIAVLFLLAYWRLLRESLDPGAALFATIILGTSAGWLSYAHIAVTDIPMAACYSLAMLLSVEWLTTANPRRLLLAGAFLGLAVLAKGLVPLVLAAPLAFLGRRHLPDLWRLAAGTLLVAAPWYSFCAAHNGSAFLVDFFWKHHFGRFASEELQHVQPFWYYIPVLPFALFPWTPLFAFLRRPADAFSRFLWLIVLFGMIFFSVSVNKLPGYLLPLLPAMSALLASALHRQPHPSWTIALSAAGLGLVPAFLPALPTAIDSGLTRALPLVDWRLALPVASITAISAFVLSYKRGTTAGLFAVVLFTTSGVLLLINSLYPVLDRQVSVRAQWLEIRNRTGDVCLDSPRRAFRYGMNYYSRTPLPDCDDVPRPLRLPR